MRFSFLIIVCLSLAACAHEAENTGAENSGVIVSPSQTYAMMSRDNSSSVSAGRISHFERKKIIPGGPDGAMSPCAKNFDGIMDHLEDLMSDRIRENNAMAERQALGLERL